MNRKYLIATLTAVVSIVCWNLFLIQRDAQLFEAYNQPITQPK